ncbi:MAG: glycosyltransferase, partial [Candidatus Hodarchaeota archaeon]
ICSFDLIDAIKYILTKADTIVVFRINECDKRKGHRIELLDRLIIENAKISDKVIFISNWLKQLFLAKEDTLVDKSVVIVNGADKSIFNSIGCQKWNRQEPLKIVTHHWGAHWFKGFDVYLTLDNLIGNEYKGKVEFTFIGNINKKIKFKNTAVIPPISGKRLAEEIKKNHIYLTASINEPAGMHHIEGASCGLPILYRNSGALPEYCDGYGISFNGPLDFEKKLKEMMRKYDFFSKKVRNYRNNAKKMLEGYYKLFSDLINKKKDIIKKRKLNRMDLYKFMLFITIFKVVLRLKETITNIATKLNKL